MPAPIVVHHVWLDTKNPDCTSPPSYAPSGIAKWKRLFPEHHYEFWNLTRCREFVKSTPSIAHYYDELFNQNWNTNRRQDPNHMCVVDMIRPLILYVYGGFYMDVKIKPKRGLQALLDNYPERQHFYIYEKNKNDAAYNYKLVSNGFLGSRNTLSRFWLDYFEFCSKSRNDGIKRSPVGRTGPAALSVFINSRPSFVDAPLSECVGYTQFTMGRLSPKKQLQGCNDDRNYYVSIGLWRSSVWGNARLASLLKFYRKRILPHRNVFAAAAAVVLVVVIAIVVATAVALATARR
jgi:hypothetical protein